MVHIESLLSARLFLAPKLSGGQIYFVSNLSGRLSLYAMEARAGGSVPQPLLPPEIALQNPELIGGHLFYPFPKLGKMLLMLDQNSDENYQPMWVPLAGGYPEPAFGDAFAGKRVACVKCDAVRNWIYFHTDTKSTPVQEAWRANARTGRVEKLDESLHGCYVVGVNADHTKLLLGDGYTVADNVLYLWSKRGGRIVVGRTVAGRKLLYGVPLEQRVEGQVVPLNGIGQAYFTAEDRGVLCTTTIFEDSFGLGSLDLKAAGKKPPNMQQVKIVGQRHTGLGELTALEHLDGNRYSLHYNIDGVSWLYEAAFDEARLTMRISRVVAGDGLLSNGVLEVPSYDPETKTHALSFCTATTPTQLYSVPAKGKPICHTNEKLLGVPMNWLSTGEDASFTSHDGLRVSARLYLPATALKFKGPRPLVYYVHGGPQSQERPNFAWFSMPLIQFLTLNGFAVFVPNARGSSGYGLDYTKRVDHDWGGQDRLDHVHAMTQVLPKDKRVDVSRAAVIGRSYGGYMTLMLAARHPELWSAAVDMFGPYDLFTFMARLPESWQTYFHLALGHPEKDREFLIDRSPRTHIGNVQCPMLVIQGQNDPRVVEQESRDVVEQLRTRGKPAEYLLFADEGHDVIKFANKVTCYNAITGFFKTHMGEGSSK